MRPRGPGGCNHFLYTDRWPRVRPTGPALVHVQTPTKTGCTRGRCLPPGSGAGAVLSGGAGGLPCRGAWGCPPTSPPLKSPGGVGGVPPPPQDWGAGGRPLLRAGDAEGIVRLEQVAEVVQRRDRLVRPHLQRQPHVVVVERLHLLRVGVAR